MTLRIAALTLSALALGACRRAGVASVPPAERPITHTVVPIPQVGWGGFRRRIVAHGARLAALGVNFARVPGIAWTR